MVYFRHLHQRTTTPEHKKGHPFGRPFLSAFFTPGMHAIGGLGALAAIGHARLHRAIGRTIALRTSPLIHLGGFLDGCHDTFLPFVAPIVSAFVAFVNVL